jgi:hypothetical protein
MSANKLKVSLSIDARKEILAKLDSGVRIQDICQQFSVSQSCVYKIRKRRLEFEENSSKLKEYADSGDRKKIRMPKFEKTDKALYYWFRQQRALNRPVTDDLLRIKAIQFNQQLGEGSKFTASNGFLQSFKDRYSIKSKSLKGEIASADSLAADDYVKNKFPPIAAKFTRRTTFNMDEMSLDYRAMPKKSHVGPDDLCQVGKLHHTG